jgi:aromatic ring hydroxylase
MVRPPPRTTITFSGQSSCHLFWSLVTAMVKGAQKWEDGTYVPNTEAASVYRVLGGQLYPKVRDIFQKDIASALIYTNSTAKDWQNADLRPTWTSTCVAPMDTRRKTG